MDKNYSLIQYQADQLPIDVKTKAGKLDLYIDEKKFWHRGKWKRTGST